MEVRECWLSFGADSFVFQSAIQRIKIYRKVILPVVFYGCETCSLTLREEPWLRVFENRVLRRIFGHKRDEVTGEWRKLHNEELCVLYSSPSIVRVIKSRRMRWAVHVECMWENELYTGCLWGNMKERNHLEDPGVDRRIILRWISRKWDGRAWNRLIWLGTFVNAVMNIRFNKMWGIS